MLQSRLLAVREFVKRHRLLILICATIVVVTGAVELWMGRTFLGPDGRFGIWEGDIWCSEMSQRFLDPYSCSHLIHGMLFYGLLWLAARRLPVSRRLIGALLLEAGWEILENSPIVIDRYRTATIAVGYVGDSVLNSMSDLLMVVIGFSFALRARVWAIVATIVAMELTTLFWVRDNLTLNIIMLLHPIDAIKAWQLAGQPLP
ncbi:MAG: hypothetical protein A2Z34_00020 [Planctomycetes bacterium RBG_16_59_8]|nr:MAG: hypothetical protein A2Z34_00020 [Planctomycetes bacterium RBG_16_59_8]